MADISAEIAAFQNAVYGEEVRSSMVSAIEKINDVCEDAESTVESFSSGVTTAISNANTAASAANTAASNANTKASAANTAATNANTAKTAANNAATAANNAASAATTTNTNITNAESARVSAENARATAEATRQANEQSRQTAETARVNAESARASAESSRASAESQRQSNEITRQGNETVRQTQEGLRVSAESSRVSEFEDMQAAFADMQRQIIPQATESTMGGVIVGDGLNVDDALLSLATTKSGSGTAVASNGAVLESVVVYGQSVQDGTPTPDAPVDVQVVQSVQLLSFTPGTTTLNGLTSTISEDGTWTISGTATADTIIYYTPLNTIPIVTGDTVTLSGMPTEDYGSTRWRVALSGSGYFSPPNSTFTSPSSGLYGCHVQVRNGFTMPTGWQATPMMVRGDTAYPYVPYGSIGLVVGNATTSIPLQGNVLASLPDGTRDTVTIDSAGHCVLEKRVGLAVADGTETWTKSNNVYSNNNILPNLKSNGAAPNAYNSMFVPGYIASSSGTSYFGMFDFFTQANPYLRCSTDLVSTVDEFKALLATTPMQIVYPLATTQTIDLGYIDMPTIPEDATISVSASMTPVIDASWWERGAEALANIVKALSERIRALEEAVAELATA